MTCWAEPAFAEERIDSPVAATRPDRPPQTTIRRRLPGARFSNLVYGKDTPTVARPNMPTGSHPREDLVAFTSATSSAKSCWRWYGDFFYADMKRNYEELFVAGRTTRRRSGLSAAPEVRSGASPGREKRTVNRRCFSLGQLAPSCGQGRSCARNHVRYPGRGFSSRLSGASAQLGYATASGAGMAAAYDHPRPVLRSAAARNRDHHRSLAVVREEVDRIRATSWRPGAETAKRPVF